ncbi:hypothetical protein AX17_004690 [Amanita inopinata Kibby_2008]|nr:hypothetical protein AX17_004690 [Amanita inopinata Kibby_2008]
MASSTAPPPSFHTEPSSDETRLDPESASSMSTLSTPTSTPAPAPAPAPTAMTQPPSESRLGMPSSPSPPLPPPPAFPDEDPPAYTPSPDIRQGEATLEVGPRRPFQQRRLSPAATGVSISQSQSYPHRHPVPQPLPRQRNEPASMLQALADSLVDRLERISVVQGRYPTAGGASLTPHPTGSSSSSSWTAYPGRQHPPSQPVWTPGPPPTRLSHARSQSTLGPRTGREDTGNPSLRVPPPPPRHPLVAQSTGGGSSSIVGSNDNATLRPTPSLTPSHTGRSNSSAANTESTSDFAREFYAVGTGEEFLNSAEMEQSDEAASELRRRASSPPAPPRSTRPGHGPGASTSNINTGNGGTVEDNRPTTKPVPGHPLLRDGKILVYPKDHACSKCLNIGYKHADPTHPCKKCWSKYSKPYSPALLYAPTNAGGSGSLTTLQKPLPKFYPPQGRPVASSSSPASPTQPNSRNASPSWKYGSNSSFNTNATAAATSATFSSGGNRVVRVAQTSFLSPPPPLGAVVYQAGDPRLGGRLCWRCGGAGRVSYFILDNSECMECGGIGRLFQ